MHGVNDVCEQGASAPCSIGMAGFLYKLYELEKLYKLDKLDELHLLTLFT